jgi:hypothetical protein
MKSRPAGEQVLAAALGPGEDVGVDLAEAVVVVQQVLGFAAAQGHRQVPDVVGVVDPRGCDDRTQPLTATKAA